MSISLRSGFIGVLALVLLLAGQLVTEGAEPARTWTNKDGKTVTGSLVEKGDDWVAVLIKGRTHKIKLATLSDADLEYVKATKLYKTLRLRVTTVKAESSNTDKGLDIRRIKVELENVGGRALDFKLIWIAQTRQRSTYGVHRTVTAKYKDDGNYFHQETFYPRSSNGAQYKGYAVRVTDAQGNTLGETASLVPFLRFLDEEPAENR